MITLFGMAGSGKSTQGNELAERFGMRWLSVGQVLRDTGDFDEILKRGDLVDDNVVIDLMNKQIEKSEQEGYNIILDGYPRDITQAEYIANNLANKMDGVIILEVPKEELWERIKLRGREDDTLEALEKRFAVFEQNINKMLKVLSDKGVRSLYVDGVGTVEEVTDRMISALKELIPNAEEQENDVNGGEIERSYGE